MTQSLRLYRPDDWSRLGNNDNQKKGEVYRSPSRQDYARLIHSPAYRRLQGKTQLFPSHESDFFRNRLTHSQEVAQIAKSIAIRLNYTEDFLKSKRMKIDMDLVEFAGLAHDIGHPPFGHNGEHELDRLMLDHGGFEGNAQTLRIISRLEKKETTTYPSKTTTVKLIDGNGIDLRAGLNLTMRSLASVIKYDKLIPGTIKAREREGNDKHPVKGIYQEDQMILDKIKQQLGRDDSKNFKTVECHIMDVADDIAYSTYDIEDSIKAEFLSPVKMISAPDEFKQQIVDGVQNKIHENFPDISEEIREFNLDDLNNCLMEIFSSILGVDDQIEKAIDGGLTYEEASFIFTAAAQSGSNDLCNNGYYRTAFTSDLVGQCIQNIEFFGDEDFPHQSVVRLKIDTFKKVETLKRFAFGLLIESPRLKMAEHRGRQIIEKIFITLCDGPELLPKDWSELYHLKDDVTWHSRVICDYISGMTDRYCVEIYSRLTGENPMTIWKPH